MTLPIVVDVLKLEVMVHGPRPTQQGERKRRIQQFRRWLTSQRVTVSSVGRRRVVYLVHLRDAWPDLYHSLALARQTVCERCSTVPRCKCETR